MITLPESVVWISTPESREARKISLFACAEVVFAVTVSITFAVVLSIYTQILISLAVAPLILLRSEAGVAMAWRCYSYEAPTTPHLGSQKAREDQERRQGKIQFAFVILGSFFGGALAYCSIVELLPDARGWRSFIGGIIVTTITVNLAGALAVVLGKLVGRGGAAGVGTGKVGLDLVPDAGIGALLGVLLSGILMLQTGILTVGVLAVVAFGMAARERSGVLDGTGLMVTLSALAILPGFAIGVLLLAFLCRVFGAITHLRAGFVAMPDNWLRILFSTDTAAPLELLPTPPDAKYRLELNEFWSRAMQQGDPIWRWSTGLVLASVFLPTLLYRMSIKSTFWLYGPLIYLAHRPKWTRDPEQRLAWLNSKPGDMSRWLQLLVACVTLLVMAWSLTDLQKAQVLADAVQAGETPFTPLSFLFVLDFSRMQPWDYLIIAAAVLTLALFLWIQSARNFIRNKGVLPMDGWRMKTAVFLWRFREVLAIGWILMSLWFAPKLFHENCEVDSYLLPITDLIYGPVDCPLPG